MPPRRSKQSKQSKSSKSQKNVQEEEDFNEQPHGKEKISTSQCSLRRTEVILDEKFQVPLCYVQFFQNTKTRPDQTPTPIIKDDILFTIKVEKKKGKKTSTALSWDLKRITLSKNQIKELEDLQKVFGTNCTHENNTIIYFGTFDESLLKYLLANFNVKEDQIKVMTPKPEVPKYFNVKITFEEGGEETKVKWNPKTWKDSTYSQFVDEFRTTIVKEWKLPEPEELERKANYVFTIKGNKIAEVIKNYFISIWSMNADQIIIERKTGGSEPPFPIEIPQSHERNPLGEMINFFSDFEKSSYYKRMSDTIEASYLFEKERLNNFVIKTNLKFVKNGSDGGSDRHGKNAWVTSFNVLNAISIDGIQSGRFLSEGDTVLICYKNRKRPLKGSISELKKGIVTALFKIKYGRVPPGCKRNQQEKEESDDDSDDENEYDKKPTNEDEVENEENNNNNNEDDEEDEGNDDNLNFEYEYENDVEEEEDDEVDDVHIQKPEDIDDINKYPYSITFEPSDSTYQRCALALLNLYDMKNSPIKKIVSGEQINSSSANKSNNEVINDASFDLTDSPYINDDDKKNKSFMKFLKLEATVSQTRCVEMILQNCISIVHGPPGCGKTSSISLFVYHLLKKAINEKKRILLCAYSNQAVENIAKFVSPIIKALGKKMVWIPRKSVDFETLKDFNEASEEEKNLSIYKILSRNTKEARKFKKLQEIKWDLNVKMRDYKRAKKEGKYYPDGKPRRFSVNEQKQMDELRCRIEQSLVYESDVVCSTLLSSARMNIASFKFDYVFVDEASQADQTVSIIPLIHHPSKLVLLGDHKQLDAMVPDQLKSRFKDTMTSLYRKLLKNQIQHEMLNIQFRMNPLIAQFPNLEFYKNRIINAPGMSEKTYVELESIPTPIAFIDVKNGKEKKVFGTTYRNIREAIVVEKIINNFQKNGVSSRDVGVITPYHGQVHILRNKIKSLNYNGLRISSVDSFQGSERDFIILSLVRTNKSSNFGFLPDKHRINVSLTRARKGIIIVGNFSAIANSNQNMMHEENQFLVDMCNFYKSQNAVYDESKIKRITILVTQNKAKMLKIQMTKKDSNDNTDNDNNNNTGNDEGSNILESVNSLNEIGSPSNSITEIDNSDYDVDSDYDENPVTADDDQYYTK